MANARYRDPKALIMVDGAIAYPPYLRDWQREFKNKEVKVGHFLSYDKTL